MKNTNITKKLAALIIASTVFASVSVPAFADNSADTTDDVIYATVTDAYSAEEEYTETENNLLGSSDVQELQQVEETDSNAPVMTMYICATAESLTGHVWLYFENISDKVLQVGFISLNPGETTSVGSLRNTRTDGGGTYYNAEAYMASRKSTVTNSTISLRMDLTNAQLATVSEKIRSMNSYNFIGFNCGNFATRVWNSVSSKKLFHFCFPIITIMEMVLMGGRFGAIEMKNPDISECYKQTDNGVLSASASSFNLSCV